MKNRIQTIVTSNGQLSGFNGPVRLAQKYDKSVFNAHESLEKVCFEKECLGEAPFLKKRKGLRYQKIESS